MWDFSNLPNWLQGRATAILKATGAITALTVAVFAVYTVMLGLLADSFAVYDKVGLLGLASMPLLALGIFLIGKYIKLPKGQRPKKLALACVVCVLTPGVLTGPKLFSIFTTPPATPAGAAVAPPSAASSTIAPPPAPPSGVPVPAGGMCPLPDPTDPALPSVEVQVVYWCKGEVIMDNGQIDPNHYQIKVRPRLMNNTSSPVNIAISNPSSVRLLVTGKQLDERWNPPPKTKNLGDRPVLADCNGGTFWAIPPNAPRDVTITSTGEYSGFATTLGWDVTELQPGNSFFKPLRHRPDGTVIQEGDLVFQVPLDDGEAKIYGLAVIDQQRDNSLLGVAVFDTEQWGDELHPTAF